MLHFRKPNLKIITIALGLLSLLGYVGVLMLSWRFNWGEGYEQRPILEYLAIYFALFALQAGVLFLIWKGKLADKWNLGILLGFGLVFRLIILPAHQIQEDDIYRYMWDGKVFSAGVNPFAFSPDEVNMFKFLEVREPELLNTKYDPRQVEDLQRLHDLKWSGEESVRNLERVNHPDVPTIYPPLAQYVFRLVASVKPDSITAMRVAFLGFDILALVFILLTLKHLGQNLHWAMCYWWSPLVIKETLNSTHLDIIGISVLCASLYFLVIRKFLPAMFFLALSVLGKIYPIILLPLYLKEMALEKDPESRELFNWKTPLMNMFLFAGVVLTFYLPFLNIGSKAFEGLRTFTTYWQNNESLFAILMYFYHDVLGIRSPGEALLSYNMASLLSKGTVVAILGVTLFYLLAQPTDPKQPLTILRPIFILMALVFLFSPVQNPWYLCWVVPFLCFFPGRAWILLTGLVGFYYLDFYFDYQEIQSYTKWIAWYEYGPFYLLLGWDYWQRRKLSSTQ